jgi:anti-sigma B factor antagonist
MVAPHLEETLRVILRLDFVRFVDSSGLGAFLSCFRRLRERNADFSLSGANPEVMAVLEIVGMQRVLKVHANLETAISRS